MWLLSFFTTSAISGVFASLVAAVVCYTVILNLAQRPERKRLAVAREDARMRYLKAKRQLLCRLEELRLNDSQCSLLWAGIIRLPFNQLCEDLRSGTLRCVDVLRAFQYRALLIDKQTNCVVQPIVEAETWASKLDTIPTKERSCFPLFGIPVSFKECFQVQNYESSIGLARYLGHFHECDSAMVKAFRQLGAVPFLLSNVPQTMLSYSSHNPITGTTNHFLDAFLARDGESKHSNANMQCSGCSDHERISPGGSTSGEAVLCGARGSPLGVGSDAGGSIRVPASLCGVAGLMCTTSRTWRRGRTTYFEGPSLICTGNGPLSVDVDALVRASRALWSPVPVAAERVCEKTCLDEFDPRCCPVPFNESLFSSRRPLRIGWFVSNQLVNPVPAVQRAVDMAAKWLTANGHELVEWTLPEPERAWFAYQSAVLTNMRRLKTVLRNDEVAISSRTLYQLIHLPGIVRYFLQFGLRLSGRRIQADHLSLCRDLQPLATREFFKVYHRLEAYREKFVSSWRAAGLDALLCPAFGSVAMPHSVQLRARAFGTYSVIFNLLEFCAGTLPVTRVTSADVDAAEKWHGGTGDETFERDVRIAMTRTLGFPVGIQVAAPPFHDEVVLRLLLELEHVSRATGNFKYENIDETLLNG